MPLDCILASTILSRKSRSAIDFGTIAGLSVCGGLLRLFSPSVMGFWSELGHLFCPSTYKNAVCERPPQKQYKLCMLVLPPFSLFEGGVFPSLSFLLTWLAALIFGFLSKCALGAPSATTCILQLPKFSHTLTLKRAGF